MRNHDHCRTHRDAELGPRGAGPPLGNLNALKHGTQSHPLSAPELERLVAAAVAQPQDLPFQVGLALRSIQARTGDTFLALAAFRTLLSQLTDRVAGHLFDVELRDMLRPIPPSTGRFIRTVFEQQTARTTPQERLLILRKIKKQREQLPEQESE